MTDIVWQCKLDERYDCKVERVRDYVGRLSMTDKDGAEVMNIDVTLAYNAQFGPDVMDVETWQEMCAAAADARKKPESA